MKKFIALATVAASLFAGTAEAREYDFSFVGYYSGLRIAEATGSLIWGDGRYKLDLNAKSDGIVDWFTVITHSTHSEGSFAKAPLAEKHYYLSTDGKKKTEIELAFKPGDVEIVAASPNPLKEKRSPVPKEMKSGSLDPLSAVLALGMTANDTHGCNGKTPVFDGRRRYDIVLENSQKLQYTGPKGGRDTYVCDFHFDRKAGYREKDKKWKSVVGKVWIQQLDTGMPMLPVRMEIQTSYGTGLVHMVTAKDRP